MQSNHPADADDPEEFLNSSCILVTSAQKLFNGLTKFGLNRASIGVDTVLMDDAHACADRIRAECRIRIPSSEPAYSSLKTLFATDLEEQGVGTYADIENAKREALLPVPYWAWIERESEVASILSSQTDRKSVKFAWPLLRDMLRHCQCIFSGAAVEIEPYVPPLNAFGSYSNGATDGRGRLGQLSARPDTSKERGDMPRSARAAAIRSGPLMGPADQAGARAVQRSFGRQWLALADPEDVERLQFPLIGLTPHYQPLPSRLTQRFLSNGHLKFPAWQGTIGCGANFRVGCDENISACNVSVCRGCRSACRRELRSLAELAMRWWRYR